MARMIAFWVLVVLSIATGVTKLIQMPAEMDLFRGAGWPDMLTLAFGILQVAGGLMLIARQTRRAGAGVMIVTFTVASVVVLINGMVPFFVVSLLFILLAVLPLLPAGGKNSTS